MPRSGPFCLPSPLTSLGLPLSGAVRLLPLLGELVLGEVGQTLQVKEGSSRLIYMGYPWLSSKVIQDNLIRG